jgi:alpha-tubulin suppressor-like RCC1 family protein
MLGSPSRRLVMMVTLSGATLVLACNSSTGPSRPGPPAALHAVTGDAQTGPEGLYLPVPLTVQVLDAGGRGSAGVTVNWTVTGGGSLRASAAPTVTDSVGLALVLWQLGSLGPQSVVASCCGLTGATFTARAVLSLAQRLTILGGVSQADTVGHTLAQPIAVQVLRADGTPDVGAVVGWGTSTPGGHFSPTFARADSAGRASTLWTLGTVAGAETSWVRVRGFPQVPVGALAYPGPPTQLTITPNPMPLLGAIDEFVVPLAEARDRYDNVVSIDVTLSAADTTIVRIGAVDTTMLRFNPLDTVVGRHHGTTWIREQFGTLRDSVPVTMLGFSAVSSGGSRFCGLSLAGDTYCWGSNSAGGLGDGTATDRLHPVLIASGLGLQLPYTYVHTCALTTSGQAYCWGDDESGELGDGSSNYATELHQFLPTPVTGGQTFATIRPGADHTCAVATSGAAYCWGANDFGQLGRDTVTTTCEAYARNGFRCSNSPILVSGTLTFAQVTAGLDHSCGVTTNGAAYCWGRNEAGELGNDSTTSVCAATPPDPCSYVPLLVEGGLAFKSVKAAESFTCGVATNGDGYCWGQNTTGGLGTGGTASSRVPVKVAGGLTFADVQAGGGGACGLTTSGKVYCWGGSVFYGRGPTPVRPDLQFAALAAGGIAGCELTTTNDLYCFGF